MKKGWQTKKLGDVCTTIQDGAHESPKYQFDRPGKGRFLYITSKNIRNNYLDLDNVSYVEGDFHNRIYPRCKPSIGDVLLTKDGANTGNVTLNTLDEPFSLLSSVCLIKTKPDTLQPAFLSYYIQSPDGLKSITGQMTGAAIKRIILRDIKLAEMPLPTLAEQQRIVKILDEAFAGIAKAKANAEKNLQNARAIFESHLQSIFTRRGKGWVTTTLGEIGKVSMCKRIFKEETISTAGIPFYKIGTFGKAPDAFITNQIYNEYREKYPFPKKGDILISASGTIGRRVRYDGEPAYFQDSNIVWIDNDEKQTLNDYLYHFYGACHWNSTKGATILRLYNDNLRRIAIAFPKSFQEQRQIVCQLDALSAETRRLASLYERKLAALEALKKSLLHQAFTGQLTRSSSPAVVIPFPTPILTMSCTDLHAGILAIAYEFHEKADKLKHYGHVKSEKISHMMEALVGIELGRHPVKDAAGPNDFQQLTAVEFRARKAGYFEVKKQPGGAYKMTQGRNFDWLIQQTREALGKQNLNQPVDDLIQLMLPLDTQQAEVVATVFAAWNNLLLDGQTPSDEQIVLAARENWHPDKLKIERDHFFKTIDWLRKKKRCPEGRGKRVESKSAI